MIKAVVFDWAGTTIDYGSRAPLVAFQRAFHNFGIEISESTIRADIGLDKLSHVKKMMKLKPLQDQWLARYPDVSIEEAIQKIYQEFQIEIRAVLQDTAKLKPGMTELLRYLDHNRIAVATTTGYNQEMLNEVSPLAAAQGYVPKFNITSEQTNYVGRPNPDMLLLAMKKLGIEDPSQVIKVGDTVNDILEGRNAGVTSVGVIEGSNLIGLSKEDYLKLNYDEKMAVKRHAHDQFIKAGANDVIDSIDQLIGVIKDMDELSSFDHENRQEILLTPGPLTTSANVKKAMLIDHGTWDDDYKGVTQEIRGELLAIGKASPKAYTSVLMQGSGTFCVEATLGTAIPQNQASVLMIAINGAYGERMAQIADYYGITHIDLQFNEDQPVDPARVLDEIAKHPEVTHFAVVHCETTTGILNPIERIIPILNKMGIVTIVDAMSSFGGVPIDINRLGVDYLISSANKCIQGVPGFGFVIAKKSVIDKTQGNARSLSLDLYEQYRCFEDHDGKWRFTSPTHVVYAFQEAIEELKDEGGVEARTQRYKANEQLLRNKMILLDYEPVIDEQVESPIITTFKYPSENFDFHQLYEFLKDRGFVIYPGKVSKIDSFRIGNIGEVYEADIERLVALVGKYDKSVTASA